ncbi:MAG: hypothetical protein IPK07_25925 [Deltaproteobacteria bacterium]|nr:hypothetical protein [Deltaproteobacteria bacterium]
MRTSTKWLGIPASALGSVVAFAAIAAAQQPNQQALRKCSCTCTFTQMGQQYSGTLPEFSASYCGVQSNGTVNGTRPNDHCLSKDGKISGPGDYLGVKCEDKGAAAMTTPTLSPNVGTLPKLTPGSTPVTPPTTPPTVPPIHPSR